MAIMDDQTTPPSPPVSDEEILRLQQKIQELTEMSKRALADLANYKKRTEEERTAFAKFANLSLVLEILPVLDNLSRAKNHIPEEFRESEWVNGMLSIEKQLLEILKKQGVTEMPVEAGEMFDPHKHEAVTHGQGEKDKIIEILDKGYVLYDKIVRPAKVKVGDGT